MCLKGILNFKKQAADGSVCVPYGSATLSRTLVAQMPAIEDWPWCAF